MDVRKCWFSIQRYYMINNNNQTSTSAIFVAYTIGLTGTAIRFAITQNARSLFVFGQRTRMFRLCAEVTVETFEVEGKGLWNIHRLVVTRSRASLRGERG